MNADPVIHSASGCGSGRFAARPGLIDLRRLCHFSNPTIACSRNRSFIFVFMLVIAQRPLTKPEPAATAASDNLAGKSSKKRSKVLKKFLNDADCLVSRPRHAESEPVL